MILPMAREGGGTSRTGVHFPGEYSGEHSIWSLPVDQNVKDSVDSKHQSRRHPILAWQLVAEEVSPSSVDRTAFGDFLYPSTDVPAPMLPKLRGATQLADLSPFSDDEDVPDLTQDGSPMSRCRQKNHAAYSLAHLNFSTATSDVTPDELSVHSEDCSLHRVKLLCSYGGKILPRPTDNQLRYVGGDTRLITVSSDIHFHELIQKMAELYVHVHTIKYKLPEEDLDALVSVASNEDVANMMEEYDRLQSSDLSPRLRLFLFSDVDHESVLLNEYLGDQRSTEQRYVDAVNCFSESTFKQFPGDGGSLAVAPVVVDSMIDVVDLWGFIRQSDTVPVAMLAPQISQDAACVVHHVPVASPVPSIPLVSSLSSPPSSPPPILRVLKQGYIPEMSLSVHADLLSSKSGHQYSIVQADGHLVVGDSYGTNLPASTIVLEHGLNTTDLQRGLEPPRKLQHEGESLCDLQELVAEDDNHRLPEVRMPRIPFHGKSIRLSDQHLEAAPPSRQRQSCQPQPSQQHGGWLQHLLEEQTLVSNRRVDLLQSASNVAQSAASRQLAQQPHCTSLFQKVSLSPTIDQPMYWPVDLQSHGEEVFAPFIRRSTSANTVGPTGSTTASSFDVAAGSTPSSPRMIYRDPMNIHASGQPQAQALRSHAASNYAEQHHCPMHRGRSDCSTRVGSATSPPRYRDYLGQTDESLLVPLQQPVVATSDTLQLGEALYGCQNSAYGQYSQFHGRNPFQDSASSFPMFSLSDPQEAGDGRHDIERIPPQSFHSLNFNAREDVHDHSLCSAGPLSVHSRYYEKPMHRVAYERRRDLDEINSWRRAGGRSGRRGQVNEGGGVDSEVPGACFLHLSENSEDHLVMSDAFLPGNNDVIEPLSTIEKQTTSTVSQSHVLPLHQSALGLTSVLEPTQVPPHVGHESKPGFPDESVAKSKEGILDFKSAPALVEVSHLSVEVSPNDISSSLDDVEVTGAINSVPPLFTTSNATGNLELGNIAESRLGGRNDVSESRTDLEAQDIILDRLQLFPGSGVIQIKSSGGMGIVASEEVALLRSHNISTSTQGNGTLAEDEYGPMAYSFHSLTLNDVVSPFVPQLSVSEGQAQVIQPVTTRVTSFSIPALSITVSTGSAVPSMPTVSANTSVSITEQEANPLSSLLFKSGSSTTGRNSQVDAYGVAGNNANFQKDNKFTSQISALGHLADNMSSSVLVSSMREWPAALPSADVVQVDDKEKWLSVSRDTTAVISASIFHAPNWDNVQNLTGINAEIDDAQICIPDATTENGGFGSQPPSIAKELTSSEELVFDAAVPILDNLKQGSSNPGSAEVAEAEAIKSGLQTILNADLEEMRELGSGTFGTVYHGKWRGTDVAIKRIKSSCFSGRPAESDRLIADFWREACTLSQLHHPNVVAFYGVVRDGPGGTLATVTEYMVNGSLKQVLQKKDRTIDRRKRLLIAMDAAFGMEYLHSKNIVHFDLKCDNLLVNMRDPHRPICKVGDLGLSKVKHQTMVSGGVRGTLPWMAPELLNGNSTLVTEKVDVFSFGVVMWELLTGEEPYASMHYGAIIGGIVNNTLRPSIPTWCDPLWKALMEKSWSSEPTCRPSFSEVASELRLMAIALQPKSHG